jgi:hypothetical protein
MNSADYLISILGFGALLFAMRGRTLSNASLRRQAIVAAVIAVAFLDGIPTAGADGVLVALGIGAGAICAVAGVLGTRFELRADGSVFARATAWAYGVTIFAFGSRIAFAFASDHGLGPSITRFSKSVDITSEQAWVAALVLMAVTDIALRAAIMWMRREQLRAAARPAVLGASRNYA